VQLGGKDYVSDFVGLGFKPQLPHFFLINYLRPMVWRWWAHVAEGQGWPTHVAVGWGGRFAWKMVWGWRAHVEDSMGLWAHIMVRSMRKI
jgi:hypothetical protein